jgi:hypothetical protein
MRGREFLRVAHALLTNRGAPFWRTAVWVAYYALFLECREALLRWGVLSLPRFGAHGEVRNRFRYARHPDMQILANALEALGQARNRASYDIRQLPEFANPTPATSAVRTAEDAVALLDAIEADPARRAAVIASLPP